MSWAKSRRRFHQPDAQGNSSWQALLNINVPAGHARHDLRLYPAPFDTAATIADAVNVIFGQPDNSPFVTITNPLPYATLDTDQRRSPSPAGRRAVRGQRGRARARQCRATSSPKTSTTINAPDAGTGGAGPWQTTLQVNVAQGTRGSIVAFSTSAQDGSIVAFASIYVTFGDPTGTDNFVKINAPLPGTLVDPEPDADDRGDG